MRLAIISVIAMGCLRSAVAGDIYCNAQGLDCSDRPSPTRTFMRSTAVSAAGSDATSAVPPTNALANADNAADRVQMQREREAALAKAQTELKKDVGDKRAEQCKSAQATYKTAVDATVLYRTGKDGKREDLTDSEAAAARLNAKLVMDRTCSQAAGN